MRASVIRLLAITWLLAACAGVPVVQPGREAVALGDQHVERAGLHWIPMVDGDGNNHLLRARVCYPDGPGPFRVVAIAHGSPPDASERPLMKLGSCSGEVARWFLERGFIVVFALRRGYGATGGAWAEGFGKCPDKVDFVRAGLETARDDDAVIAYATTLPRARRDGAVVVGQSAGGWGTLAYNSIAHARVAALVNMAGGRGGHDGGVRNHNCRADLLEAAAKSFGATATTPMLWIYTQNDSFFAPEIAERLHEMFISAGAHAELHILDPFGGDGHLLFNSLGGSHYWGPLVEAYLATQLSGAAGAASSK